MQNQIDQHEPDGSAHLIDKTPSDGHGVILTHVQGLQQFTEMQNTTERERQLSVKGLAQQCVCLGRNKKQIEVTSEEGVMMSGKGNT